LSKTLPFKDQAIKGAAYDGAGRETEYRIEGQPGLVLAVQPPGRHGTSRKTWRCYYSVTVNGKREKRKPTLGHYPATTLATARRLCADIMDAVDAGRDPVGEEKAKEAEAKRAQLTFSDMLQDYVEDQRALDLVTIGEIERALKKDAVPLIGDKRPSEITPLDVEAVVDAVCKRMNEAKAARQKKMNPKADIAPSDSRDHEMARHVLRYLKQVFNHALIDSEAMKAKYGITTNPAVLGRSRRGKTGRYGRPKSRKRFLNDAEIIAFWKAMDASNMAPSSARMLKIALLTGVRASEVREAVIEELDFSASPPRWTIPKERTKRYKLAADKSSVPDHIIDLPPLVAQLFAAEIGSRNGGPVFQSQDTVDGFPDEKRLRQAIDRLFDAGLLTCPRFSPHDLRRTVGSGLAALGVPELVIKRILNHSGEGVTQVHYVQNTFDPEARDSLILWSRHVHKLLKASE
jgi:integrase